MLQWKEVKGFNKKVMYNMQPTVELPKLGEEVLFQYPNDNRIWVGEFREASIVDTKGGV